MMMFLMLLRFLMGLVFFLSFLIKSSMVLLMFFFTVIGLVLEVMFNSLSFMILRVSIVVVVVLLLVELFVLFVIFLCDMFG